MTIRSADRKTILAAIGLGGTLTLDDLVATSEVGDWEMPRVQDGVCLRYEPGLAIVEDDRLTLTTAGLACGMTIA